jgi:tripartite ATP-independent transporter DctM subunit
VVIGILFLFFLLSAAIGVPIAFCLGLGSLGALLFGLGVPLELMVQRIFTGIDLFPLMAVPLFILTGELMNTGGVIDSLIKFADSLVGYIRGGLAHSYVVASMFLSGITGSGVADASALGSVNIPLMEKSGYDKDFACGLTAAAAVIGPVIPPSIPAVVYAMAAQNVSVSALLISGVIPGGLIGIGLMIVIYILSVKRNYPKRAGGLDWRGLFQTTKRASLALLAILIILGGILSGVFTATEAAGIAALYALVVGLFVTHDLKLSDLPRVFVNTGVISGTVLLVVATANIFAWILATQQVPQIVAKFIMSISPSPWLFMLWVNLFLLVVGCLMETVAAMVILVPILAPIAVMLGFNSIHFGFIFVYNLAIGLVTPPLGLALFVTAGIGRISLERITKAALPFLVVEIVLLVVFSYFPSITLFLPDLFGLVK